MGVNPASFAHRCALVVFPMPGGPVIITPRKLFIPFLPGFLKLAFKLSDLEDVVNGLCVRIERRGNLPVTEPLSELFDLSFVPANLFDCLRGISISPKLRIRVYRLGPVAVSIWFPSKSVLAHPLAAPDPAAPIAFSRASISFALSRIAFSSFSFFFFSFSLRPLPLPGPLRVAIRSRNSSSDRVLSLCFLMAASLLEPALSPSTT